MLTGLIRSLLLYGDRDRVSDVGVAVPVLAFLPSFLTKRDPGVLARDDASLTFGDGQDLSWLPGDLDQG